MGRTHLHLAGIPLDNNIVVALPGTTVPKLLSLYTQSPVSTTPTPAHHETKRSKKNTIYSRALQNTGTFLYAWRVPAITHPAARP